MRWHFELIKGAEILSDVNGLEIGEPRAESLLIGIARAMREIENEDAFAPGDWQGWQLRVITDDGKEIVSVALDQLALHSSKDCTSAAPI
jgi:hypothetical protein